MLQDKVILFAVPGAFTPTCTAKHLPSFIELEPELRGKGINAIYCLSVNDRFVMKAWAESVPNCAQSDIVMVADGNAELSRMLGLINNRSSNKMGIRSKRYAMIIEKGRIVQVLIDESGYQYSSAQYVLSVL
jgi:peroxiredoxin